MSKKFVVTGGGGFVGKALCKKLREQGAQVTALQRGSYPELEALGVNALACDLSKDTETIKNAVKGADAVFHVASKIDMWGAFEDFFAVNVIGTRNMLEAAQEAGVKKFIYTSSPSVVADGRDLEGIDESYPYPKRYHANYPKTKSIAEQEVLKANSSEFWTLSLRPHLIWGPGDTNLVPMILKRAEQDRLVQVGDGTNAIDICFIEDCVEAHICAERALEANPDARAKAYFVSQGEPVNMWDWINEILERNGFRPIKKKVPAGLAQFLGGVFELYSSLHPNKPEPLFTRFLASEMATSHYFDISAARRELGFEPKYSVTEAMAITFRVPENKAA